MKSAKNVITILAVMCLVSPVYAGVVPIDSITAASEQPPADAPIMLESVTVGAYTVGVEDLRTGTSSGEYTGGGTPGFPIENADNFNINSFASQFNPHDVIDFGGGLYSDANGDDVDFFIFENGGNDSGTIQAILPDDSLGATISFGSGDFGDTGFDSGVGGQNIKGLAFAITDLLDVTGAPLTNDSIIKGIHIASGGLDPSSISAVVPEPASLALIVVGGLVVLRRRSR